MVVDSLDELKTAFASWRSAKQTKSESVPDDLVKRARRAARAYGVGVVASATKMTYQRLRGEDGSSSAREKKPLSAIVPSYSRVELAQPSASGRLLVEVEMVSGVRLRAFVIGPETLALLSRLCGAGGHL